MSKYPPPMECRSTQQRISALIPRPSDAVLSTYIVVHSQKPAGSMLKSATFGSFLLIPELPPTCRSEAISIRALAACYQQFITITIGSLVSVPFCSFRPTLGCLKFRLTCLHRLYLFLCRYRALCGISNTAEVGTFSILMKVSINDLR